MQINFLELFFKNGGKFLIEHAGSFMEESRTQINQALGAIAPILLGRLIQTVDRGGGTQGILDLIREEGYNGKVTAQIAQRFGSSDSFAEMLQKGSDLLMMLLNDKGKQVMDEVSEFAGTGRSTTTNLFSLSAFLMMDQIGKTVHEEKMGEDALRDLLRKHAPLVQKEMPSGLQSLSKTLHFEELENNGPDKNQAPQASMAFSDKNISWALAAICLVFLLLTIRSCIQYVQQNQTSPADDPTEKTAEVSNRDKIRQKALHTDTLSIELPDGERFRTTPDEAPAKLAAMMEKQDNGSLIIQKSYFGPGSNILNQSSFDELPNIVRIFKAYPGTQILLYSGAEKAELAQQQTITLKRYLTDNGIPEKNVQLVKPGDPLFESKNAGLVIQFRKPG
jgi:outer membrane protein OmpA-like peptidoglycan-associated protein